MKKILIVFFAFCIFQNSFAQFFQGTLTYKIEYEIDEKFGLSKEDFLNEMRKRGDYSDSLTIIIKNGNYIRKTNSSLETKEIYRSDSNKIFNFSKEIGFISSIDAKQYDLLGVTNLESNKPIVEKIDSSKTINGIKCKYLKLAYDELSQEYYLYNSDVAKLDANLFKNHNYQYLNKVLGITNSYPLEFVSKMAGIATIRISLVSIKDEKISDDIFDINKVIEEYKTLKENDLNKKIEFYKNLSTSWKTFGDKKIGYTVEYPEKWAVKGSQWAFYTGLKKGLENSEFSILIGKIKDKERIDFITDDEDFYDGYNVVEKPVEVNGIKGIYYLRTHKDKPEEYHESVVLKTKTHLYNISNAGYKNQWFEHFYKSFKLAK